MTPDCPVSIAGLLGTDQRRPLYSRLPGLYFNTPPWAKAGIRRLFGARQGGHRALVEKYLDRLTDLPSADGNRVPLLLTHDVDTAQGYATLPRLLEVEEAQGLASLIFIVTHRYRWDSALLAALETRGHCFGVHDTTHDNRLAYLSVPEISDRLRKAQQALGSLDCGAFRAPAFLRSAALYEGISGLVKLDLSSNDWALLWPHPGDGIGSPFPIRYREIVCAPTTLPRDGELLALGIEGDAMIDVYRRKATELWRVGAPAILLTHPDPTFTDSKARIETYARLLRWFKDSGLFDPLRPAQAIQALGRGATLLSV